MLSKKDSGIFGTMFDLNGDGKTDVVENALMLMMLEEIQKEENPECEKHSSRRIIDLDDLDIEEIEGI